MYLVTKACEGHLLQKHRRRRGDGCASVYSELVPELLGFISVTCNENKTKELRDTLLPERSL